ncbi:putative glycosyltransferase EpsJ [bacterium BMS3Abin07]|nr:putative glycosyltransferase EpsJ [bacterium BMS3Abin07]
MKLSVIIPCLDAESTIGIQLEALYRQDWAEPWEVIVSDNGSTDKTLEIIEGYKKKLTNLHIVDSSDRKGVSHARNVGARCAKGESLAFCDADDEIAPGWVAAIGEATSKYDFVASRFEMKKLNLKLFYRKHQQETGLSTYGYPPFLSHAGGSGLAVKRSIHDKTGGFDESMPRLNDTDYCWRIQLKGIKLHFAKDAVVHVRNRNTLKDNFRQARLWGEYNVFLYKKYLPFGMPKLSWKAGIKSWIRLLMCISRILDKENRCSWIFSFGWCVGRLYGSIKYRVLAL